MPTTTNSQYMSLPVPIPTVDPGPQYATDLNTCLTTIDSHDHSPGRGTPVTPAGININQDLSFGSTGAITSYNATNLRSTRYSVQASPLSGVSDIGCVYLSGVDLYFNDRNSNQIRLTAAGSIAGSPGSITGLVSPANVTYTSANQTFTFQSSTATPANIDVGSITIRNITANSAGITLSPPSNLTTNYTITASSGPPISSSALVTMNSAGNLAYATPVHMTPWTSYSLTIHADTDPTPGPLVTNAALWRQVGDSMQVKFDWYQNGGGAAGSGIYIFPLPSSVLIDTTKISVGNQNGLTGNCGSANVQTGSNSGVGFVTPRSSTGLSVLFYNSALVAAGHIFANSTNSPMNATSAAFSFFATVPIQGWS